MEFVIKKSDLVRELQTVTGVVEKRATLPILANLLIEAGPQGLSVGASDLEVTIRGTAKATVVKPGSVTLPAGKLYEIARSLNDSDVQFKLLERHMVAISCERTRYKIAGQARDEFPKFPDLDVTKVPRVGISDTLSYAMGWVVQSTPNGRIAVISSGKKHSRCAGTTACSSRRERPAC